MFWINPQSINAHVRVTHDSAYVQRQVSRTLPCSGAVHRRHLSVLMLRADSAVGGPTCITPPPCPSTYSGQGGEHAKYEVAHIGSEEDNS